MELQYCQKCTSMTNHDKTSGKCLICKSILIKDEPQTEDEGNKKIQDVVLGGLCPICKSDRLRIGEYTFYCFKCDKKAEMAAAELLPNAKAPIKKEIKIVFKNLFSSINGNSAI